MNNNDFYTLKGYQLNNNSKISTSMEDYLEMICRTALKENHIRITSLALKLNVKPSSATKMVANLQKLGLVQSEKYGVIMPTEEGWKLGNYLLHRHEIIHEFLCLINNSLCELEQVEQIEHFINKETLLNLEKHINKIKILDDKNIL